MLLLNGSQRKAAVLAAPPTTKSAAHLPDELSKVNLECSPSVWCVAHTTDPSSGRFLKDLVRAVIHDEREAVLFLRE